MGFGEGEGGRDREGELYGVDTLADGVGEGAPIFVTLLAVGRNGVVDECLDSVF